jgi:hypothetical protein
MNCDTCETDTVQLTLPLYESQQLDRFLNNLLEQLGAEVESTSLASTSELIGDANFLATWLREYVRLELPAETLPELIEVLTQRLTSEEPCALEDDAVLTKLRDQLKASVASLAISQR